MEELQKLLGTLGGVSAMTDALGSFGGALKGLLPSLQSMAPSLAGIIPGLDAARNGLGQGRDEMGRFTAAGSSVNGMLASMGPYGQAAAGALAVLTAALTVTVGTLLAAASAAIGVTEKLAQMQAIFGALAGSAAGGAAVTAMVQKLGQELPFATDQIAQWVQGLQRAGVAGKDLEAATRAIAAAAALNPAGGADAAASTIAKLASGGKEAADFLKSVQQGGRKGMASLREMGLTLEDLGGKAAVAKMSADELTKAIEKALVKKGAGPLDELGSTFPVLIQKVREGFFGLFDKLGPAVKPFMAAVKSLFGEFSKGGGVINALKPIVTGVLTTLFSWATRGVTAIHDLVTWLLNSGKAGGTFSGVVAVLKSTWGALVGIWGVVKTVLAPIVGLFKAIFSNALVLDGLKGLFRGIAIIVGIVVVVVAALVAGFILAAAAIGAAVGVIAGVVLGIAGAIYDAVDAAIDALSGLTSGAGSAASDFVGGLVDGIVAGASAVAAAVAGLASGALGAFKGVLGIASHSKVLKRHGDEDMAGATAEGIDRGAGRVKKAAAKMGGAAVPGKGKAKGGAGGEPGERAGTYIDLRGSTFNGTDESLIRSVLERVWQELSGEAGAGPATT